MALDAGTIMIMPTVVMTVIIGVGNIFMMIRDESGSASSTLGHGASALIGVGILTFISMNWAYFLDLINMSNSILGNEIVVRIAIVLVAALYVHIHSGVFKGARGQGMHETWIHSLVLGLLIAGAPYIWMFVGPMLPAWMQ
ncbi:hypothetical protein HOC80_05290 [archaeon]|jgi:hypothetical protein|nr:hypothetical protein [archaeon]MBT4417486.1 hypothetical protein [archaeon]